MAQTTQLFTVPAQGKEARAHFVKSILKGVDLAVLNDLHEALRKQLAGQAADGRVYAWGALPEGSSEAQWKLLRPGDLCLFYTAGHFPVCGRVSAKARSYEAAKAIWGTGPDGRRAWELLWFFDEIRTVGASHDTVREALGHKPTARFQRFLHVAPAKEQMLRSQYGTIEGFIAHISAGAGGSGPAPPSGLPTGTRPFESERPPPRSTEGNTPANSEETRAKQEKANVDHHAILVALSIYLAGRACTAIREMPKAIDLEATRPDGVRVIFEAKTLSSENRLSQTRGGFAQLHEYRHEYRDPADELVLRSIVL